MRAARDWTGHALAAEHRTLFRRVASGNLERALQEMRSHLDRAVRNLAAKR